MGTGQCKTQTADYCFQHANAYEQVTIIVPLFSNSKNNSPQSVCSLHILFWETLMTQLTFRLNFHRNFYIEIYILEKKLWSQ